VAFILLVGIVLLPWKRWTERSQEKRITRGMERAAESIAQHYLLALYTGLLLSPFSMVMLLRDRRASKSCYNKVYCRSEESVQGSQLC
jgi:hypothetical protein